MTEPKIVINTIMTKEDYKKFLYISTFKKNKTVVLFLCLVSLIGSMIIGFEDGHFSVLRFIISWILLFLMAIIIVTLKIERRSAQRVDR